MDLRISGLVPESIVDGPGYRYVVFTQGCPHNCKGCHNPDTHDFNGGRIVDTQEIIQAISNNPLLDGLTLSGGDPFCQAAACTEIARAAHELGLNVWAYTGYTFEQLTSPAAPKVWCDLIDQCDYIVDGRFELDKRSLGLHYRGSSNQRIIDVKRKEVSYQWE